MHMARQTNLGGITGRKKLGPDASARSIRRYFDVAIAEQHASPWLVHGLRGAKHLSVLIYSTFYTATPSDQLIHDGPCDLDCSSPDGRLRKMGQTMPAALPVYSALPKID